MRVRTDRTCREIDPLYMYMLQCVPWGLALPVLLVDTSIFCINRTVMGAQRGGGGYVIIHRVLKVEVHNRLVPVMLLCSNPTYNRFLICGYWSKSIPQ